MSASGLSPPGQAGNRPHLADGRPTEPELRRVTVLFADIQGSTALIHDLDAEDAASLIDPALQAMIEAAERFDGAVSHRGDGIMAVFGAPTVVEDHALRACLAALAMRDAVAAAGEDAVEAVQLRIGIHSGEVVFRPVRINGALVHDAVGIAVHIAARLEQSAAAGMICLSGTVLALAGHYLRTAALPAIAVKGIEAPLARHQLLAANPSTNRWAVRAARGLSAFVGRRAEMTALEAALAGDGTQALQIVGPAGMGKSRLIHEFLRSEAAQARQVFVLTGDHLRHFAPFHPITAWLRTWLGLRDADGPADARAKLAAGLAAIGNPAGADPARLERLLGLGAPTADAPRQRIDFGGAIAAVMIGIAGNRKLLLVCEDADRFDPALMELLETALPRLAQHGTLLVSASRVRVRFAGIPPALVRALPLAPLDDSEASAMLSGMDAGRGAPPAQAAEILRKAAGNPLFLEEVAPLVAQSGPTGPNDAALADIPERVEELIADRLGRLPPVLRALVQLCAVVGPDVPMRLVAPLAGLAAPELEAALLRLADEQLLYESRKYPDPQFSFKHALTREVAYKTILVARRRVHHGRIADVLADADPAAITRDIDELCHHTLRAQRWEPAVAYLRIAAREAMARTAFQAAIAALRRARDVATNLPDDVETARIRLAVLTELSSLVRLSGSYAELGPVLDEAEILAVSLDDRTSLTDMLATRVHMFNILGRLDEAIALGERTRVAARSQGDVNLLLNASFFAGQSYFNAGRLDDANRLLGETLQTCDAAHGEQTATPSHIIVHRTLAHGTRAMARALRGAHDEAMADIDAARPHAQASHRPYDRIFLSAAAGFVLGERRDARTAAEHFRAALALSETSGIVQLRPPALAGLGHALLMLGETEAASETLSQAHRLAGAEQRWMFQLFAATGMALAGLALGEPDLAHSFAADAVKLADRHGFSAFRVSATRVLGTVLASTGGRHDEGYERLQAAIAAAEAAGMVNEIARGHAALGALGAPRAAEHLRTARKAYTALGMRSYYTAIAAEISAGRLPYI